MLWIGRGRKGAMSSNLEREYHCMNAIVKAQYQVFHLESGDNRSQIVQGEYRGVPDKTLSSCAS